MLKYPKAFLRILNFVSKLVGEILSVAKQSTEVTSSVATI